MSKSVCSRFSGLIDASKYRLWCAQYANNNATGYKETPWTDSGSFSPWDRADIYQYSSRGRLTGWAGDLDLNKAYIDAAEWEQLARPQTEQQPTDTFQPYAGIVTASALNVRKSPAGERYYLSGQPLMLPTGMVVAIYEERNGWGRVADFDGWVSLEFVKK